MVITRDNILDWITRYAEVLAQDREYLTQLDAAIGDADHGANMDRGFRAVMKKMPEIQDKDIGTVFKTVGMTLLSTVGGAGGPLYSTIFLQAGMKTTGKMELTLQDFTEAIEAGVNGVKMRGKAELGDKTMIDALVPALNALKQSAEDGIHIKDALERTVRAAEEGMIATTPLVARKGRASYLGERSAGHQDPGATSSYLLLRSAGETLIARGPA